MDPTMFEGFDTAQYEEEARQKWGGSPEFAESQRRTKAYTKKDWDEIRREGGAVLDRLAALSGVTTPAANQSVISRLLRFVPSREPSFS